MMKESTSIINQVTFFTHLFSPFNRKNAMEALGKEVVTHITNKASEKIEMVTLIVDQSINHQLSFAASYPTLHRALNKSAWSVLIVSGSVVASYLVLPAAVAMIKTALSSMMVALSLLFVNWILGKEGSEYIQRQEQPGIPVETKEETKTEVKKETEGKTWASDFEKEKNKTPEVEKMVSDYLKEKPTQGKEMADAFVKEESQATKWADQFSNQTKPSSLSAKQSVSRTQSSQVTSGKQLADEYMKEVTPMEILMNDFIKFEKGAIHAAFSHPRSPEMEKELQGHFIQFKEALQQKTKSEHLVKGFIRITSKLFAIKDSKDERYTDHDKLLLWQQELKQFGMYLYRLQQPAGVAGRAKF